MIQVSNEITRLNSKYEVLSIYGGSPIDRQIDSLRKGVAILVATPGRLIDLIDRKVINFGDLEVVCID